MKLLKKIVVLVVNVIVVSVGVTAHSSEANKLHSNILAIQKPSLKNKLVYLKSFDGSDLWITDPANIKSAKKLTKNGGISSFTISYDLTKIVVVKGHRGVYFIDLLTGKEKYLGTIKTGMNAPSLSPSNDKIVISGDSKKEFPISPLNTNLKEKVRHIWLIDVLNGKSIDLWKDSNAHHIAPHWSPDGSKISFASASLWRDNRGWTVYVVDMHNTSVPKKIGEGVYSEWADNKTLIVNDENENIVFYNIDTLEIVKKVKTSTIFQSGFSFAPPDGLYYGHVHYNPDGDIGYLDMKTLQHREILQDAVAPMFGK